MEVSQLQARIDAVSWYHEFDFGDGLKTPQPADVEVHAPMWRFIEEQLAGVDFRDKTVLDIGCWDGYWSFYAERRGAKSVLATDDFTQNWASENGLFLAKELLKSRVQINARLSVYELSSLGQRFDIVLFLGVYYHLFDPFLAFAQVRRCCHPGTLVCIEGNEGIGLPPNSAVLNPDVPGGKYLPSISHLRQLLRATYFSVQSEQFLVLGASSSPPAPGRLGWRWRLRMCMKALRGSRRGIGRLVRLAFPISEGTSVRRVFLLCTPIEGENSAHFYRPPFGLHAFDPRFRGDRGGRA